MSNADNKEELQNFLGMSNYFCRFIPNYSKIIAPLCTLPQNNVEWSFDQPQLKAIDNLKDQFTNQPFLQFYNPPFSPPPNKNSQRTQVNLV